MANDSPGTPPLGIILAIILLLVGSVHTVFTLGIQSAPAIWMAAAFVSSLVASVSAHRGKRRFALGFGLVLAVLSLGLTLLIVLGENRYPFG